MPDRKTIFGMAAAAFVGCASMTGAVMAQAPPESPVPGPASGLPEFGPERWQVWHTTPVTPIAEQLSDFHGMLFVIMFAICALVLFLLAYVVIRFNAKSNPTPSRTSPPTFSSAKRSFPPPSWPSA